MKFCLKTCSVVFVAYFFFFSVSFFSVKIFGNVRATSMFPSKLATKLGNQNPGPSEIASKILLNQEPRVLYVTRSRHEKGEAVPGTENSIHLTNDLPISPVRHFSKRNTYTNGPTFLVQIIEGYNFSVTLHLPIFIISCKQSACKQKTKLKKYI